MTSGLFFYGQARIFARQFTARHQNDSDPARSSLAMTDSERAKPFNTGAAIA